MGGLYVMNTIPLQSIDSGFKPTEWCIHPFQSLGSSMARHSHLFFERKMLMLFFKTRTPEDESGALVLYFILCFKQLPGKELLQTGTECRVFYCAVHTRYQFPGHLGRAVEN